MEKKLLSIYLLFSILFLSSWSGFGQCNVTPTASIARTPQTICAGATATITFTATPLTTVTYQINSGTNQTIPIGSSGSNTLSAPNLTITTIYSIVSVKYTNGKCNTEYPTGSATVTVNPNPTVNAGGAIAPICQGGITNAVEHSLIIQEPHQTPLLILLLQMPRHQSP